MNKWTTTSGCTVHQTLKGRNNSYLVSDGDHHLLVDTGQGSHGMTSNKDLAN